MVPQPCVGPSKSVEVLSWDDLGEDGSLLDVPSKKSPPEAQDSGDMVIRFQSSFRCQSCHFGATESASMVEMVTRAAEPTRFQFF